jgi:hypothetical protein
MYPDRGDRVADWGDAVVVDEPARSVVWVSTGRDGPETRAFDEGVLPDAVSGGRRLERVRTVDDTEVAV